jgi:hypothetical protein
MLLHEAYNITNFFCTQMAAACGCAIVLLLCVLVVETAVMEADAPDSAAARARGQGRTPNGKRRQVNRHIQSVITEYHSYKLLGEAVLLYETGFIINDATLRQNHS